MKNKGFTLIELLAVIVILAIIALIAVPIILNIIEDARKESDERSVELYASAIKNGIATHQLRTGNEVLPGTYNETNPLPFTVEYEGKVECTTTEIYEDGKIYLEGCTVNGGEETYNYGTKQGETPDEETGGETTTQVYKPQYYSWTTTTGNIGGDLPSDAKENATEIDTKGKPFYLGLDVDSNNKVTAAYVCFTRNGQEYCLKGYDTSEGVYATNQDILRDAYKDVLDTACSFGDASSTCDADGFDASADSNGVVNANDADVGAVRGHCYVYDFGGFDCYES